MTMRLRKAESDLGRAIFSLRQHTFPTAAQTATEVASEFAALQLVGAEGLCHAVAASAFTQQGAIEHAGRALESAMSRARAASDQDLLATCFEIDADRQSFAGHGDGAHQAIQRAVEIHQSRANAIGLVRTRATMAEILFMLGRAQTAVRLLAGIEDAVRELDGPADGELLGRVAGAKACAFAHMNDGSQAFEYYREAAARLTPSVVPSVTGRVAMNVAHYLAKRGGSASATEILGDGISVLKLHGNATLEGKLCAAQAFFALQADNAEVAERAIGRSLELFDSDTNADRQRAILELAVEVALATEDRDRLTERRMALAERYVAIGETTTAVTVLVSDLSDVSAGNGAVLTALRDVLAQQPLNSYPVEWFVTLTTRVAHAGHLPVAAEWLDDRLAMERGADRAHLLAARADLAVSENDIATADAALFEAIHIGRLLGLDERERWIAMHRELTQ